MEEEKRVKIEGAVCRIPRKDRSVCHIPLAEFPQKYIDYVGDMKDTICLERRGARIMAKCHDSKSVYPRQFPYEVKNFIREILLWAFDAGFFKFRYDGAKGIYPLHTVEEAESVADKIHKAAVALQGKDLKTATKLAVQTLDNSQGTGVQGMQLSIASKVLRMMSPEKAGAFDEKHLQEKLLYSDDSDGYAHFCLDCNKVAEELNQRGHKHEPPIVVMRGDDKWRAADVESVVFNHLRMRG